jgi:hypothetical protein
MCGRAGTCQGAPGWISRSLTTLTISRCWSCGRTKEWRRGSGYAVGPGMAKGGNRGGQGSRTVPVTIQQPVLVPMTGAERAAAASVFTEILADWWTKHANAGQTTP